MKVLKSWGAAGEVVLSRPAGLQEVKIQEPVFIVFDGLPVPFFVEWLQHRGNRSIVKFEGVDSLAEAEELVGREATVSEENLQEEDTLIGLKVRDSRSGRIVGEIVDFRDYGGNLVVTVDAPGLGERLLPVHEELIVSIHDEVITLDIPEGLL